MAQCRNGEINTENSREEHPNLIVYKKIERLVEKLQDEKDGVRIRTKKKLMSLSKDPSVFTGSDLVSWLMKELGVDQAEATHLGSLIAAHGYFFPITDHVLQLRDDKDTYYRFQTPFFWPSKNPPAENTDYAVYLCKRAMQNKSRLELADYESENLAKLQRMFSRKWEFIFMQAEAQAKVDKKRDKLERKVMDSQERAFWDVYRPVPGCVSTTEVDIKKQNRKPNKNRSKVACGIPSLSATYSSLTEDELRLQVEALKRRLEARKCKTSKVAESLIALCVQYAEYDALVSPIEPTNPWLRSPNEETGHLWEVSKTMNLRDVPPWRVKRWGFCLEELLKDQLGRDQFAKFLAKEYSQENLKFWLACQELKGAPQSQVRRKAREIYDEFLSDAAKSPINVDSKVREQVEASLDSLGRYSFEVAQDPIFQLMKSDSYTRYLKSEGYRELLNPKKKTRALLRKLPSLQ